ncbi:hypothetical protein ACWV26_11360 [Rummeliibacillus sp. JY-2-4R]
MDDPNKKTESVQHAEQYVIKINSNSPSHGAIQRFTESILDVIQRSSNKLTH